MQLDLSITIHYRRRIVDVAAAASDADGLVASSPGRATLP